MTGHAANEFTDILVGLGRLPESEEKRNRLFEVLYQELHRHARLLMGRERREHTLSPTALVHEAYLRLIDQSRVDGSDRARFFGIASRAMRQILIEHARARLAQKRGGHWKRVTIESGILAPKSSEFDMIVLDDALAALSRMDERSAVVTEMKVFGGLTHHEIAALLNVSPRTVDADWAYARKWLSREIAGRE